MPEFAGIVTAGLEPRTAEAFNRLATRLSTMWIEGPAAERPATAPFGAWYHETDGDKALWWYAGEDGWLQIHTDLAASAGPSVLHESLTDLQGGKAAEHYHFEAAQHGALVDLYDGSGMARPYAEELSLRDAATEKWLRLVSLSAPAFGADRFLTLDLANANRTLRLAGGLTVEAAAILDQDYSSDASPLFAFLRLTDAGTAFALRFVSDSTTPFSANRDLTLDLDNAARTLKLQGNLTVEAASFINQDLTSDSAVAQFADLVLTNSLKLSAGKSLYFDGGVHTRILESADDVLDVYVGAVNALRIIPGKVGIGLSPVGTGRMLHIYSNESGEGSERLRLEVGGGYTNTAGLGFYRASKQMGYIDADYWGGLRFYSQAALNEAVATQYGSFAVGGAFVPLGNVQVQATKKVFFDGGTHTYRLESSDNVLDDYVGGSLILRQTTGVTISGLFLRLPADTAAPAEKDLWYVDATEVLRYRGGATTYELRPYGRSIEGFEISVPVAFVAQPCAAAADTWEEILFGVPSGTEWAPGEGVHFDASRLLPAANYTVHVRYTFSVSISVGDANPKTVTFSLLYWTGAAWAAVTNTDVAYSTNILDTGGYLGAQIETTVDCRGNMVAAMGHYRVRQKRNRIDFDLYHAATEIIVRYVPAAIAIV